MSIKIYSRSIYCCNNTPPYKLLGRTHKILEEIKEYQGEKVDPTQVSSDDTSPIHGTDDTSPIHGILFSEKRGNNMSNPFSRFAQNVIRKVTTNVNNYTSNNKAFSLIAKNVDPVLETDNVTYLIKRLESLKKYRYCYRTREYRDVDGNNKVEGRFYLCDEAITSREGIDINDFDICGKSKNNNKPVLRGFIFVHSNIIKFYNKENKFIGFFLKGQTPIPNIYSLLMTSTPDLAKSNLHLEITKLDDEIKLRQGSGESEESVELLESELATLSDILKIENEKEKLKSQGVENFKSQVENFKNQGVEKLKSQGGKKSRKSSYKRKNKKTQNKMRRKRSTKRMAQ